MKAHRTDRVSLVFALLFLALAGWWLLAQLLDLSLPAVGWFLAGALILIGLLGLFGALRSGRPAPPADTPAAPVATPARPEPVTDPSQEETDGAEPGSTGNAADEKASTSPPGTDRS